LTRVDAHGLLALDMATGRRGNVLVIDDDEELVELLEAGLSAAGFAVTVRPSADSAYDELIGSDFDAVLTDLSMPGMNGLEFCERAAANRPDVPVVVMTAYASLDTAVSAMRVGAEDFVTKPLQIDALALRLDRIIQGRHLREEVTRLREAVRRRELGGMVGESAAMSSVRDLLDRVVDSDASVLITGESGTGKEVVARALHDGGRRKGGPFVAINCSAVPEQLLESELFGHVKGAFTDARTDRAGLFVQADGGTLFLDEIGDMPTALQPKLLRALQERTVRPIGGDKEVSFDVRVVTATNRDLESAVAEQRFREDLYFRINVIHVDLPPLRARGRDVLILAQHFLDDTAKTARKPVTKLSSPGAEKLLAYHWPGNVRELQNCIEHAVALARFEEVTVDDLPARIRNYKRSHVIVSSDDPTELIPMEQVEARYITRVMEAVNANKTMAAKTLGFDRKTLYRKLDRYGIEVEPTT
jgi:two-component system response regulator HydG